MSVVSPHLQSKLQLLSLVINIVPSLFDTNEIVDKFPVITAIEATLCSLQNDVASPLSSQHPQTERRPTRSGAVVQMPSVVTNLMKWSIGLC